ncbi:nuclear transport factor 2 family protein [Flavobacterium sp. CYK-55]|uniref:nuclear transport factor 2 family protein n=1 Tax=Flavobacterium sp. CYK-55 TaxID=2835529 RepID=UPI001BCB1D4C|nr:nuclear transport factor 2 family protein [Flavobacterium sp. CYK-55]MBS7787621.1 nuclear transport factor 2 family protein [Flavobacterium sp. CYK-55]
MKNLFFLCLVILNSNSFLWAQNKTTSEIDALLNQWHKDAAVANGEAYFGAMADEGIFIGTDATENWNKKQFQAFAKPYFDKGKAWDFKPFQRHIYLSADEKTAWFDELLDTWMKICRGSGVLQKVGNNWKIMHYVLSTTIPNDNIDAVVKVKTLIEDEQMKQLKASK